MAPFTVLVPLDGSELSRQIVLEVRRLLVPQHYRVILLRVAELSRWSGDRSLIEDEELAQHPGVAGLGLEAGTTVLMEELWPDARYLEDAGYTVVPQVCFGDAVEEIVALVEHEPVDIVAMATHGRSGLRRLVLGSVAEAVLGRVRVPVLLVRPHSRPVSRDPLDASAEEPA